MSNPQRYLLLAAIVALFLPSVVLDDGTNIVGTTLKYGVFLSLGGMAVLLSRSVHRAPRPLFIPLGLLCIFGLASTLWSEKQQISIERAVFNFVMVGGLLAIATRVAKRSQLQLIHDVAMAVSALILIGCLPAYLLEWQQAYFMGNFRGSFYNANLLGHWIGVLGVPYALTHILEDRKCRWAYLLLLWLLGFFLFESRSRAGVAASVVSAGYVLYCLRRMLHSGVRILIAFVALSAAAFVVRSPGFLVSKYADVGIDSAFGTRGYLWRAHLEAIDRRPLLGWGLGVNPVSFKSNVADDTLDTEKGSSFITLPEELGIPVTGIMVIALCIFAIKLRIAVRQDKSCGMATAGVLPGAIVLGGFTHAMGESWLFYFGNPMSFLFWICCVYLTIPSTARVTHVGTRSGLAVRATARVGS